MATRIVVYKPAPMSTEPSVALVHYNKNRTHWRLEVGDRRSQPVPFAAWAPLKEVIEQSILAQELPFGTEPPKVALTLSSDQFADGLLQFLATKPSSPLIREIIKWTEAHRRTYRSPFRSKQPQTKEVSS